MPMKTMEMPTVAPKKKRLELKRLSSVSSSRMICKRKVMTITLVKKEVMGDRKWNLTSPLCLAFSGQAP